MNEVIPGIYRIEVPLPDPDILLGYVNSYLVRGDKGFLMVDTGWNIDAAYQAVAAQLAEIGADIRQISQIVITHIHPDHYGLAGRLKEISHARLYVHRLDTALVQDRYLNMDPLLKQTIEWFMVNGVPPTMAGALQNASVSMAMRFVLPVAPDVQLEGGETISTGVFDLKVVWTPGHSKGHICLYEPANQLLFSGDHMLPNITPNIGLHPQSSANPIREFIASLRLIAAMDINLVLPGHEKPFTGAKERVAQLIEHHETRKRDIAAQLDHRPMTGYEVARGIPWHTDIAATGFDRLSFLDQRLAVVETLAHLEFMRSEGQVVKAERNGVIVYQKV